ncbi:hypothetical protein FQ330_03210 [Agrococcus sediminis]|uniref:Uncharacterized protein n=1 Tax=Agrococcus sediminis TaxID=2599924 RepID=A0A5M8QJU0_9MICO|nr:hypothetical protein [Agrococcus sediminis]KAA6436427.1 hypothetical protein FQ330_03210 [Agrococcus sediminis]
MPFLDEVDALPVTRGIAHEEALEYLRQALQRSSTRTIAGDESTSEQVLDYLSEHESVWVRMRVGANPSSAPASLNALAFDMAPMVRHAVAGNPTARLPTLSNLALDTSVLIRCRVASNPSLTGWELLMLDRDEVPAVRAAVHGVARGRTLPLSRIAWLIVHSETKELRSAAEQGWVDREEEVKAWLALNHAWFVAGNTPLEWVRPVVAEP